MVERSEATSVQRRQQIVAIAMDAAEPRCELCVVLRPAAYHRIDGGQVLWQVRDSRVLHGSPTSARCTHYAARLIEPCERPAQGGADSIDQAPRSTANGSAVRAAKLEAAALKAEERLASAARLNAASASFARPRARKHPARSNACWAISSGSGSRLSNN